MSGVRPPFGSLAAAAVTAGALLTACVEDPLAVGADTAPGASSPTVDVTLAATELPVWRDTTYSGFALPTDAVFSVSGNLGPLRARTLGLLEVPDTIRTFADTLPVEEFSEVDIRIQLDTVNSTFSGFPVTVRLVELTQGFDEDSVSWLEAAPGRPWATPGGDLGREIASAEVAELADSVVLVLSVPEDSLLKAWQDEDGGAGFAVLVEGPEARVQVQQVLLRFMALLEGREVPVGQTLFAEPRTFITDPPLPPTGTNLRIGGLPAARFYLEFELPDRIGGTPLEGSTVNHAELMFRPLAAPADPYSLERLLAGRQFTLLADPFEFGPKTPIGASPLEFTRLDPDSLAAGNPVRLDISLLVADAARQPGKRVRLGLRGDPDAQTLGFWEFGSVEAAAALRPLLRIVLTPPPDFDLP